MSRRAPLPSVRRRDATGNRACLTLRSKGKLTAKEAGR